MNKRKIKYTASLVLVTFEGNRKVKEEVVKKHMTKSDFILLDSLLFRT